MFYLTTHSTHYIYCLCGVRHMVKDHTDSEKRNPQPPQELAARVLLHAKSHRQESTYHCLCYISRGTLAVKRNSSMGPPRGINPTTHRTINGRSITELHFAPSSRITTITE